MKIVLTGFMGTGKTSVGRELSRMLGYQFVDTDVLIEEREGMPISLIFKTKGEGYFREIEQETVAEVSQLSSIVIATGGGVIKNRASMENLGRGGVIFWLKADPEMILRRVMLEGGRRPLLDVKEPLREINKLLSERIKLYEKADMPVDTNYITPRETAIEIVETLGLDSPSVNVDLGDRSYEIIIGSGVLQKIALRVRAFRPSRIAIISNRTVFPLYGDILLKSLRAVHLNPDILLVPDGEEYKDFLWSYYLYGQLLKARVDRNSLLIALGGGVIGDMAGFVASTYMRGIRYIQAPTTLLAQVDSSVGGKTGVNHPLGKNMIGTFYQPSLVMADIGTLRTLPAREFNAGIAEIIKYGVIADRNLFDCLMINREDILASGDSLVQVIKRSCEIKADVVAQDEKEAGLRAILNFGHTIGHAVETVTGYRRFLHGEAVAIGMCAAAELAVRMKLLKEEEAEKIRELIQRYDLPCSVPDGLDTSELIRSMGIDKKVTGGRLRFVLPDAIGSVRIVEDIDRKMLKGVLQGVRPE